MEERIGSQVEVEVGFTEGQVVNETGRCLECGCLAYFDCDLRKYASDFGVDIAGLWATEEAQHRCGPSVYRARSEQVHQLRPLREDLLGDSEDLGPRFVYRGFKSVVKPSMEKKLLETTCISCGNCIAACPTGASRKSCLSASRDPGFEDKESVCSFCSVGCNLNYQVFQDDLFTVSNVNGASHNKGYLCAKGRLGYRYMMDRKRLLKPMIRRRGERHEATWDEALDLRRQTLKSIVSKSGPESIAVFGSPRLTNEELYLLQKFVRTGFKTNNIGSFSNLLNGVEQDALDNMFGVTTSSLPPWTTWPGRRRDRRDKRRTSRRTTSLPS